MKRVLGTWLIAITFFALAGCEDLFTEPVKMTAITRHQINWDQNEGIPRSIELWWDWAEHTDEHILERSAPDDGLGFVELMWDEDTYYWDAGHGLPDGKLTPGHQYVYRVCGHASNERGPWSSEYTVSVPPFLPPQNVSAELLDVTPVEYSEDYYNVRVRITWDSVSVDNVRYRVFRDENLDGYYSMTGNDTDELVFEDEFRVEDRGQSISRYYKVASLHDDYGQTEKSSVAVVDIRIGDDGGGDEDGDTGGSGSWVTLGTDGFASASDELAAATVGSTLYVGFPDETDTDNRIRVMQHDGSDGGSWSAVGDHLSLDAVEWDELTLSEIGGALYAGYADTDDSVTSGGSSRIFVKKLVGSSWSTIGDSSFGHLPMLAGNGTDLYMVYPGSSSGLLESRKYAGSGTTWNLYDDAYWFDNGPVASYTLALDVDGSGNPVVAVGTGQAADLGYAQFDFYRNGGSWAPHLGTFTPSTGSTLLELYGLRYEGSGTPYLAYSNADGSGVQASCGLAKWNGSVWEELDLLAEIGISDGSVHDLAMIPAASGNGVLVAAGYRDGTALRVELWHYNGSDWQQIGPDISAGTSTNYPILTVTVQYDGSGNPVVVFADNESGSISARGFRE
ncbi:MAG: hypothetical protein WD492_11785 [Alkalispirochaeta sp.]